MNCHFRPRSQATATRYRLLVAAILGIALGLRADGVLSNLVSFASNVSPYAGLVQSRDGSFYGMTEHGGDSNKGTIFRIAPDGAFTVLHSFRGQADGAFPYGALIAARDGNLYGTAPYGGRFEYGTVFRLSPDGTFTNLHSFSGSDGAYPFGSLVQASSGRIYGTTASDSTAGRGTVFFLTTNGLFISVHTFTDAEGLNPYAGLVQARDGNLYGTTVRGGLPGSTNFGTIFRLTMTGTVSLIHSFDRTNGAYPVSGLVVANDGNLYGMTSGVQPQHGVDSLGTVFRVSTQGAFTNLYSFTGGTDGANPYSGLIQASDGALYGTTSGGENTHGSVFKITLGGAFSSLVAFNGGNGSTPYAGVIQAADGNLYGTTTTNGANGGGTVFQYSLSAPPFFIVQPVSKTVNNKMSVTLTVLAGGTAPLSYRWIRNSRNVIDSDNVTGATTSTLNIGSASAADAGSYSVIVSNPYGQVVSSNATLRLVVVRPAVRIISPAPNARTSNDVSVVGKATGKFGVSAVFHQLNGGEWAVASTDNGWTNWSAVLAPTAGTNVLRVYAIDSDGRVSVTNAERFFYTVLTPIAVHVSSGGSVRPNLDGRSLAIGQGYGMLARPARGFAFRGWSGSVSNLRAPLKFIMQPGFELSATFADIMRPHNLVLSPRTRQHFTNDMITVSGKARDNAPGFAVLYQLNGSEWNAPQTTNAFTNWTAQVTLAPGTNVIRAYAIDASGLPSLTNTVTVQYTP